MGSDFALVSWALGVGHSCPTYLGLAHICACRVCYSSTPSGVSQVACMVWPVPLWEVFTCRPPWWAPLFALQAPPFPLRHSPLRPLPWLLRKPADLRFPLGPSPLLLRGVTTQGSGGCPSREFSRGPPLPLPFIRQEEGCSGSLGFWGCQ